MDRLDQLDPDGLVITKHGKPVAKLVELGRIELDLEDPEVVRSLSRLHVWPIDLQTARASTRLDIEGDPADELIAATSVLHRVPLLTRDRAIRKSKVVPLVNC